MSNCFLKNSLNITIIQWINWWVQKKKAQNAVSAVLFVNLAINENCYNRDKNERSIETL